MVKMYKILLILILTATVGCSRFECNEPKFKIGDVVRIKGLSESRLVITDKGTCAIGHSSKGNIYGTVNALGIGGTHWEHTLEKIEE